ncbi:MAG TPA: hypothetical protein VH186_31680 [Chloroflexia bacterium]|nr:hypothetical protein [Chloroflexia bacterium]
MPASKSSAGFSLLWPEGHRPGGQPNRPLAAETDLGLETVIRALALDGRHSRFVAALLGELNSDPAVITYRQEALEDFIRLPQMAEEMNEILPHLAELSAAGREQRWGESLPLYQIGARLGELEGLITSVEGLANALEKAAADPKSAALTGLRAFLAEIRAEDIYQQLVRELPELRGRLDMAGSVTLGINLDAQLRPESATLVSINPERFSGKNSLLERLFGEKTAAESFRGSTPLYKAVESRPNMPEHELFRELNRLLERVAAPVGQALAKYTRLNGVQLAALEPELAFYIGASRMVQRVREAGLSLCRPEIAAAEAKICRIEGIYSLDLALRWLEMSASYRASRPVVTNEVSFKPEANIIVLTGPNSGGKTTYTRAVGQAQALFQAGLPVPGTKACLSPVDAIFTHFASAERLEVAGGRLAEELGRLSQIFHQASPASLVLLNEPLASTDHASARVLSRDLLAGLRLLGARAIFVTHIHELAEDALPGTGIVSLVAGIAPHEGNGSSLSPTYTIRPGQPQALGYASELARQHGLSLSQIEAALRERGLNA